MSWAICPHPNAPNLSTIENPDRVFRRLVELVSTPGFKPTEAVRALLREACLVNCFFFLKYICGTGGGPYTKLDEDIHLEMANFLQSEVAMAPGSRVQVVMPRGTYKSTLATHGFATWLIIRDPNVRIRIVNAVIDRAQVFLGIITSTFHLNPLVTWLFPEFHIAKLTAPPKSAKVNLKELIVPCRTIYYPEPTVKAGGATGSSEGDHHDWLFIDDPVGMEELDALHRANTDMEKKRNWFEVNTEALLMEPEASHVRMACTFYSPDDPNQIPVGDAREIYGYRAHWFKPKPTGRWLIYYRKALEDGWPAFPKIYSKEALEKFAKEKRWYFITQLQNDIHDAGTVELAKYDLGHGRCFKAEVTYDDGTKVIDWVVTRDEVPNLEDPASFELLRNCDVVMSCDPAATEEGMAAKACRTAVHVWARDRKGYKFLIWLRTGFVGMRGMFDWIFEGMELFEGAVRGLVLETNGYQKILKTPLAEEMVLRKRFFAPYMRPSTGGKEAKIRAIFGNELAQSKIICCNSTWVELTEEKDLFPGARYFMDNLDAAQMAIEELREPAGSGDDETDEAEVEAELERLATASSATGY